MVKAKMDFIMNNQGFGDVGKRLMEANFDPNVLRPYLGKDEKTSFVNIINKSGELKAVPINNATTTLRKDDWKLLDDKIIQVSKERLRAIADLRARGLTYSIPNGMGKTVLETETMSDIDPASVSMDGLRRNANDRPVFELTNLPLPIIHKDFSFSLRQIMASRNGGSPLDTTSAGLAGRRVIEEMEKLLLGVSTVADLYSFGGGVVYGYTDFPNIISRTVTAPTAAGWTGTTLLHDVMAMKQDSQNALHYGPWMLYFSSDWDQYLDDDYKAQSERTVRNRLRDIEGIIDAKSLDYLTGTFEILLVQFTEDVIRLIEAMDITTLQWSTEGGLLLNFKVMAIVVPQVRADQNSRTGIIYATI